MKTGPMIITLSTIRNEADILEAFVRYHLQIVDRMIIVDHRSADDTSSILAALQAEGLPLEVHREEGLALQQGAILTRRMKAALREHGAAWFLPLDADEFIVSGPGKSVRDVVKGLPSDRVVKIPWKTYVPTAADDPRQPNVLKRIRSRRAVEMPLYYKVLVPRKTAERNDALVAPGSHAVVRNAGKQKELPSVTTDQLALAHFPVRSSDQITTKAFVGWLACLAKPNREPTENHHLKKLYDGFKSGTVVSAEEIGQLAMQYASDAPASQQQLIHDPLLPPAGEFELRYTTGYGCRPVAVLAEIAEEFAAEVAFLRRTSASGNISLLSIGRQWFKSIKK